MVFKTLSYSSYLAQLDTLLIAKMGDLAPAGSRAVVVVVVVDNFLSQTGRETFKGENYTLQRNESGDIAIFNDTRKVLCAY